MTSNVDSAMLFLLNAVFGLYLCALILRVALQLVRADFYNPLAQFIWQITQLPVEQLQRAIPHWRRVDLAAVTLAYVVAAINIWIALLLLDWSAGAIWSLWFAVLKLIVVTLHLYSFCIFVQALMSWLGPGMHSPANTLLWSVTEPILRPVRQYLPPVGGLDLSPLLVLLVLQVAARLVPLPLVLR
ncbi:MAG: YggT family protein [Nevskiales bacterium]